ncbi:MAG: EAL domain-containing protein [Pseudomonadota bacterium]
MINPELKSLIETFLADNKKSSSSIDDFLLALTQNFSIRSRRLYSSDAPNVVNEFELWRDRVIHALDRYYEQQRKLAILSIEFSETIRKFLHCQKQSTQSDIINFLLKHLQSHHSIYPVSDFEYLLLAEDIGSHNEISELSESIISAVLALKDQRGNFELDKFMNIGISVFPNDSDDVNVLIDFAQEASNHSKKIPSNNYLFYSSSLERLTTYQVTVEAELRQAFVNNEITLYYQPKYRTSDKKIIGVEALMRWVNPVSGEIAPLHFIDVAEKSGIIIEIGEWSIEHSIVQLREWHDAGFTELTVSINLSSKQLQDTHLVHHIEKLLAQHGLSGVFLEIEIKEPSFRNLSSSIKQQLQALKDLGIQLAWDDFGIGSTSLYSLFILPFNIIKIENVITQQLAENTAAQNQVKSIIAMAHELNVSVTAEGVETEPVFQCLKNYGCDDVQGFHLSEALPPEAVSALLIDTPSQDEVSSINTSSLSSEF